MPFGNFFKKEKVPKNSESPPLTDKEKKALFGLKVVQAQQNPEPIYDLSGCSAPFLPNDTYTFCRLLGKTTLNIKGNTLTSLESGGMLQDLSELKVLDASDNKIEKIPIGIMYIKNLQVFNLSKNMLKSLPESISYLHNLEELYLSQNKFSKVPLSICSLAKLKILDFTDNNLSSIPKELSNLQHSLECFKFYGNKVKGVPEDSFENIEVLMRHLCDRATIEYEGLKEISDADISMTNQNSTPKDISNSEVDDIMIAFMRRKDEQLRSHMAKEEIYREKEKQQLENVLQNTSANKEELLLELSNCPDHISSFEDEKQKKLQGHIQLEEKFRNEQNECLDLYLSNTSNKESLIKDISAHETNLQQEVQSIVEAKENDRAKLLQDLSKVTEETNSALEELLNFQQMQKSTEFAKLITDQENEIQKIITGLADTSVELRQADIMRAMQSALMKEAAAEAEREKIEEKQKLWVNSLIKEGEIEMCHLENLMNNKAADQEAFVSNLLQEEKYQEEAFKVLLSNVDLKRNNVIKQIALVEYELMRLSALEVRKRMFGVREGSSKMTDQRKTLVDLLCSLFQAKDERDKELESWVNELAMRKSKKQSTDDFWLMQYQQLMNMKPPTIAEAEKSLDPKVHKILVMSNALNLLTVFAKHNVTFSSLLNMTEEDFAEMDIGSATYHSIQRALHTYLSTSKLSEAHPSAPEENDITTAPSAPYEIEEASASFVEGEASAPSVDQFAESECVVCMNHDCRVLFIPCGHVCVCATCCQKLSSCPLCRSDILNRRFVYAN